MKGRAGTPGPGQKLLECHAVALASSPGSRLIGGAGSVGQKPRANPSLAWLLSVHRKRVCLVDSAQHKAHREDKEGEVTDHQGRGGGEDDHR